MTTGNLISATGLDLMQATGFTIVADKLNFVRYGKSSDVFFLLQLLLLPLLLLCPLLKISILSDHYEDICHISARYIVVLFSQK